MIAKSKSDGSRTSDLVACPHCFHGAMFGPVDEPPKACPHCLIHELRNAQSGWSGDADAVSSLTATAAADEIERLRGLLWYAWHEFNAIRARSGAPLDHHGMTLCTHEYWDRMTEAFQAAIGPEAAKPWPSTEAKAALPAEAPQE